MTLKQLSVDARVLVRRDGPPDPEGRCVVYWMQRAQRTLDNPALETALQAANELNLPLVVFLAIFPYPGANLRHYGFLLEGLAEIAAGLASRHIGFVLRRFPDHGLLQFCAEVQPALVVGDENPVREPERWRQAAARKLRVPFWTVDADVVVPARLLEKEQYAAYTIRPRIHRLLPQFLRSLETVETRVRWRAPAGLQSLRPQDELLQGWNLDRSVSPVAAWQGGAGAGLRRLRTFLEQGLGQYEEGRNHPELDGSSRLSVWLHFGHLGPLTIALAVQSAAAPAAARDAYLEQLIVRRELAINFVRYNPHYDSFDGSEEWARRTLLQHVRDPRPMLYPEARLERAETGDELWNAAQIQMVERGWMHNRMRMYWAKKILEWSRTPAEAWELAVRLNDRYELDGRDPNGYAGIAWAIGGKHDRPWFERPVFGTIRYMSEASYGKKFDSRLYRRQMEELRSRRE